MTNQNPGQGAQQGGGSQKPGQQEQKPGQGGQQGGGGQQKPGQQQQEPGRQASKADNRISVKYYRSVRSLSPGSAGGFFYWIAMRDERRSSCKRLSIDAAFRSMKATVIHSR
jgi:hypothetical protein